MIIDLREKRLTIFKLLYYTYVNQIPKYILLSQFNIKLIASSSGYTASLEVSSLRKDELVFIY